MWVWCTCSPRPPRAGTRLPDWRTPPSSSTTASGWRSRCLAPRLWSALGETALTRDARYVFTMTAAGWHQAAQLEGSDSVVNDGFGDAVAISGNAIVVGADTWTNGGRAYVFTKTAGEWQQATELKGPDTGLGDDFGRAVAVSGSTVVVGDPMHDDISGAIYVFRQEDPGLVRGRRARRTCRQELLRRVGRHLRRDCCRRRYW